MLALDSHTVELIITEGRYHQVRRMFAALGNHVVALERRAIGALGVGELPVGEWRLLSETERGLLVSR
jgi:16S rRNA pseudouridine516 synthase